MDNESDIENASIFVSVINYRDCEGQFTLTDLFTKAANPSRIFVGYCLQYDAERDGDEMHCDYTKLIASVHASNIRSLFIPHFEARGPVYARHLVQSKLHQNEKYCLQIDAHCRFVEQWDCKLIQMFHQCNDARAVITAYPNPFSHSASVNVHHLDTRSSILCADKFGTDGFLRIKSKKFAKYPKAPILARFVAAGFNFGSSAMIRECPQNASLKNLFFGEEILNAAVLWTNGFNFYCPTHSVCFHLYQRNRTNCANWRELFEKNEKMAQMEEESQKAVHRMLNGENNSMFGTQRTLKQYEEFCGVNFKKRTISKDAKYGGIEESERETLFEELQQNKLIDLIASFQMK